MKSFYFLYNVFRKLALKQFAHSSIENYIEIAFHEYNK